MKLCQLPRRLLGTSTDAFPDMCSANKCTDPCIQGWGHTHQHAHIPCTRHMASFRVLRFNYSVVKGCLGARLQYDTLVCAGWQKGKGPMAESL